MNKSKIVVKVRKRDSTKRVLTGSPSRVLATSAAAATSARSNKNASAGPRRPVVVQGVGDGLPSFAKRYASNYPVVDDEEDCAISSSGGPSVASAHVAEQYDDGDEQDDLPSETLMVFTSLVNDRSRSIAIPITAGNNGTSSSCIYGVLPCQLHAILDHNNNNHDNDRRPCHMDVTVSREVQDLLHRTHTLCRLRLSSKESLSVLLFRSDYLRAVDSIRRNLSPTSSDDDTTTTNIVLEWFVNVMLNTFCDTVTESDLEGLWHDHQRQLRSSSLPSQSSSTSGSTNRNTKIALTLSFRQGLSTLVQHQILRVCDAAAASTSSSTCTTAARSVYQLWLPHWGLVVQSWQHTRTQLMAHLKRSQYKERSLSSLVSRYQHNSSHPIPIEIVIEALVSQGRVVRISRPSGIFVKLV